MRNLTLRMKLIAGFGCLVFVLIVMAAAAYLSVSRLAESAREFDSVVHREDLVRHMETGLEKTMNGLRGFVLVGNEDLLNHYEEGRREYQESADEISRLLTTTEGKKHFSDIATGYDEYHSIQEKTIQLRRAGNTKGAVDLLFDPHSNELRSALQRSLAGMIDIANRLKNDSRQRQQQTEGAMRLVAISLAAIGLGLGVVVALLMSRSILVRIGSMLSMIQQVAANNLATEDVEVTSQDELGQASSALNSMKNNLNVIMQSIASTAEQVASASEEISANATEMANGSEAQKDQVRQVATAMQEMSATVHEVSENSNQAADSARQTAETARQGGAIVEDTLGHMRSIAGSVRETAQKVQELGSRSDQIGKIVGVIDDIADQTNLLALNAAIEAARAGEQGRGFAVVADEVRKLAERTTKATKEIAEMIQSVQADTRGAVEKMQSGTQQVEKGVEVTAKAGESLKQIIGQAEHVGEMVTHIATAATEQSSATEQVNNNMDQINKLVAESAEGAQQSAQACEQLSSLALELQNLVSRFQLGEQAGRTASSGYRSPRRGTADPGRVRTALALPPRPPVQHAFNHVGQDRNGE